MAINKKLIHFNKFSDFNSKKLSANAENTKYTLGVYGMVQTGSPEILYQSICYIKDTKQQWTHGQLYEGSKPVLPLNETDPVFSASPAAKITEADITVWDGAADLVAGHDTDIAQLFNDIEGKQDTISDLATIRDGAAKGATAVQPNDVSEFITIEDVAAVATSGNYNDLTNKPTIPSAVTESTVSGWGFTKNAGTITGVSANGKSVATNGVANIPAASTGVYGVTKLSSATNSTSTTLAATPSAVKAAYDLANSYKGTVTGVKINGSTHSPLNGVVDLGSVITSHQILKTINGQSIIGSGDVVIGGGNVQAVDTGDVLDDVNVDYATKTYVDGLVGDINSVLESIINGGVTNLFPITLIHNGGVPNDTYAKVYTELQKIVGEESTPVVIDSGLIFIDLTSFAVMGSNNYEVTTVWYNSSLDNLRLAAFENGPEQTVFELSSDGIISVRFI